MYIKAYAHHYKRTGSNNTSCELVGFRAEQKSVSRWLGLWKVFDAAGTFLVNCVERMEVNDFIDSDANGC